MPNRFSNTWAGVISSIYQKFPEDFTRFYVVQVRRFFQPRDVKPDVRSVLAVWDSLNLVSCPELLI